MKKSKFFKKGQKLILTLVLFILVFASTSIARIQAAESITGWLWGGSEDASIGGVIGLIDGNETGVGWISMSSTNSGAGGGINYGVQIGDNEKLSGYAWSENIGWVSFNESDLFGCPLGPCNARIEGDKLLGWARIMSIPQAGNNAGGWQGWIALDDKDINDEVSYGVEISKMDGIPPGQPGDAGSTYAWSEELGWIDFSGAMICISPSVSTYLLCQGDILSSCDSIDFCSGDASATCTVNTDKISWTCSNVCGSAVGTATIQPKVEGVCGPANESSFCQGVALTDSDLCSSGTPSPSASNLNLDQYQVTWTCDGVCGGSSDSCSARGKKSCGWIETNP